MNLYTSLTKSAVETFIKERRIISPPKDLPEELLRQRAGTFVTITKKGKLRGCIGTYLPTKINIAQELIYNAIAAATEDYRFNPIKEDELPELSYTVYILSTPQLVKEIKPGGLSAELRRLKKELNPQKYGIIVKTFPFIFPNQPDQQNIIFKDHHIPKTGLLLPDIEEIDTVEKQISIACQKGGIIPEREKIFIYRFITTKYQQND